jgi:hypothetical protein
LASTSRASVATFRSLGSANRSRRTRSACWATGNARASSRSQRARTRSRRPRAGHTTGCCTSFERAHGRTDSCGGRPPDTRSECSRSDRRHRRRAARGRPRDAQLSPGRTIEFPGVPEGNAGVVPAAEEHEVLPEWGHGCTVTGGGAGDLELGPSRAVPGPGVVEIGGVREPAKEHEPVAEASHGREYSRGRTDDREPCP